MVRGSWKPWGRRDGALLEVPLSLWTEGNEGWVTNSLALSSSSNRSGLLCLNQS